MFGRIIVAHRARLGLTQEALAEMAGLTARSLRELEAGRVRAPRKSTVASLADAFGLRGTERERFCQRAFESEAGGASEPPAQLPADVAAFTGRGPEIAHLDAILSGPAAPGDDHHGVSTAVVIWQSMSRAFSAPYCSARRGISS